MKGEPCSAGTWQSPDARLPKPGKHRGTRGTRRPRRQALRGLCSLLVPRETPVPLIMKLKFCSLIYAIHINQVHSTLQENAFHPNENLTRGN